MTVEIIGISIGRKRAGCLVAGFRSHQKASVKLMIETTVNPPYTHPKFWLIQKAAGVPANNTNSNGTTKGVQHGLAAQATPNMMLLRRFFGMTILSARSAMKPVSIVCNAVQPTI